MRTMLSKKTIIIGLFLLLIILITIIALNRPTKIISPNLSTIPTPIPLPTTSQANLVNEAKIMNLIISKQPLSSNDQGVKTKIDNSLNNVAGSPIKNDEFRVDYLHDNDQFQVEILTTDFNQAKKDAVSWFTSEGFSMNAVCKLPVIFYLNFDIKQELPDRGINFNPLAEGC